MTTKEQERKALEKIRKIVEELGQDSYIGVAFEGVLEDAEQNIEWDAAFSMKARLESADKEYKEVFDKVQEQEKKIEALEAENEKLRGLVLEPNDMYDCIQAIDSKKREAEEVRDRAAIEIVNFADDPGCDEFKENVCEHRRALGSIKWYEGLAERVRKVYAAM